MKKLINLVAFVMLTTTCTMAQVNPKNGYIVTNGNDTIRGTIDLRTARQSTQQCMFKEDGKEGYRTYLPTELKSYFVSETNQYYVSKKVDSSLSDTQIFLECLVIGDIDLYAANIGENKYFLLENADGKMSVVKQDNATDKAQKQGNLASAYSMLSLSTKAQGMLYHNPVNRSNMIKTLRTYNEEVCASPDDCIVYESSKGDGAVKCKLNVMAGITSLNADISSYVQSLSSFPVENMGKPGGVSPTFGIGADFMMPRFSKNLMVQTMVMYCMVKGDKDMGKVNQYTHLPEYRTKYDCSYMDIRAGLGYCFGTGKLRPTLSAGVSWGKPLKEDVTINGTTKDYGNEVSAVWGYYAGAGVRYNVYKKSDIFINANYLHNGNGHSDISHNGVEVKIGYSF